MFFSVKRPLKILGKTYIPCICYNTPKFLEATVEKLKEEGTVDTYDKPVGFMNGKVLEKKKAVKSKKEKKETVVSETVTEDLITEGF